MKLKSPFRKSLIHAFENFLVGLMVVLLFYVATLVDPSLKEGLKEVVIASLGFGILSFFPKYSRENPNLPVKDYVNE